MLSGFIGYFRGTTIANRQQLEAFLSSEASYLAQRSTYEYSRNTLGYFGQHAFGDDGFNDAMRRCRWESFAAVLADMVVLTHAQVAPVAGEAAQAMTGSLAAVYRGILGTYPLPAYRDSGWDAETEGLRRRLDEARDRPAAGAADVARVAARRVYKVVPVRSPNAAADYAAIEGAIRLGMVSFDDRMRRRVDPPRLVRDLADDPQAPPAGSGP